MKIEMGFTDKGSYLRYLNVAFRHLRKDWLNFDVVIMVNVLGMDFIRGWINSAIEGAIKSMMHLPHKFEMNFELPYQAPLKELKQGEYDSNGKYEGAVSITLNTAKNLPVSDSKVHCILRLGKFWLKSKKTTNSNWGRQNFILPIDTRLKEEERFIQVEVGVKDLKDKNFIGKFTIPLQKLTPNQVFEEWYALKGSHAKGELQLQLEYDTTFLHPN